MKLGIPVTGSRQLFPPFSPVFLVEEMPVASVLTEIQNPLHKPLAGIAATYEMQRVALDAVPGRNPREGVFFHLLWKNTLILNGEDGERCNLLGYILGTKKSICEIICSFIGLRTTPILTTIIYILGL